MAAMRRTTMYSGAGKKLYAVRNADGSFKDIQTYERAHRGDLARKSAAETATKKSTAKRAVAKKSPAKKSVAKKAAMKKTPAKKGSARKAPAKKAPARKSPARKAARRLGYAVHSPIQTSSTPRFCLSVATT